MSSPANDRSNLPIEGALRILAVEKAVFESIQRRAVVDFKTFWRERVGLNVGPESDSTVRQG